MLAPLCQVTRSGNQAEGFKGGGSPAPHLFLFRKMPPGPLSGGPGFTQRPLTLNQAGLGIQWLTKAVTGTTMST